MKRGLCLAFSFCLLVSCSQLKDERIEKTDLMYAKARNGEVAFMQSIVQELNAAYPNDHLIWQSIGNAFLIANMSDSSLFYLDRACKANPETFVSYFPLAGAHFGMGN